MSSGGKSKKGKLNTAHDEYNSAYISEMTAIENRKKAEEAFINICVDTFREEQKRISLVKIGRELCYSEKKLLEIEAHFAIWNRDEVDVNIAEEIRELQIFIDERTSETLLNKISNVFKVNERE